MILYFSATGNTKYVAERLAAELGDSALNLLERIRKKDYSPIRSEKPFVVCSPVIVCEMPRFFLSYLRRAVFSGSRDLYFVFTSGGYAGISGQQGRALARKKNMRYMGRAELTMPRNYIASDAFPELTREEIEGRIREAAGHIPDIAATIRAGGKLRARHVWLFEPLITLPFNPVWSRLMHRTRDFHAGDQCISCGKCERCCPVNAIRMEGGRPVWTRRTCAHCMACIQSCPAGAIEYGLITAKKQRYRFEKYKNAAEER